MLLETLSNTLDKALRRGNVTQQTFQVGPLLTQCPTGDGVYPAGAGGQVAPNRVLVLPFYQGPPGRTFYVRLFGWRPLTDQARDPNKEVWIPLLLAELAASGSNQTAPASDHPGPSSRYLSDTERLCDAVSVTAGQGYACSTGPGTDLVAWALIDLVGSKYFQFDFSQSDDVGDLGMNALWATA